TWQWFQQGIPYVAVHDLVIQPEEKHLVVGTHGRSIYRADISHMQLLDTEIMNSPLHVFELDKVRHSPRWGNSYSTWGKPVTPGLDIVFYSGNSGPYTAHIRYQDDIVVSEVALEADKGLNVLSYDLAFSKQGKTDFLKKIKKELKKAQDGKTYLPKGEYTVELEGKRVAEKVSFTIE
ncbi:MAG: glycosyl hydrolase, partial [Eudoraea sp.]|nr:glycosyl hydrolase [Eudoraea sp.]